MVTFKRLLAVAGTALLLAGALPLVAHAQAEVCPDSGSWTKINSSTGSASGDWGSFAYSGTTLTPDINAGHSIEVCVKSGSEGGTTFHTLTSSSGPVTIAQEISHISWRVVEVEQSPSATPSDEPGPEPEPELESESGVESGVEPGVERRRDQIPSEELPELSEIEVLPITIEPPAAPAVTPEPPAPAAVQLAPAVQPAPGAPAPTAIPRPTAVSAGAGGAADPGFPAGSLIWLGVALWAGAGALHLRQRLVPVV